MRVDHVEAARKDLAAAINETHAMKSDEVNSLLQLLAMKPAAMATPEKLSPDTKLLLSAINTLSQRMAEVEQAVARPLVPGGPYTSFIVPTATDVSSGSIPGILARVYADDERRRAAVQKVAEAITERSTKPSS